MYFCMIPIHSNQRKSPRHEKHLDSDHLQKNLSCSTLSTFIGVRDSAMHNHQTSLSSILQGFTTCSSAILQL